MKLSEIISELENGKVIYKKVSSENKWCYKLIYLEENKYILRWWLNKPYDAEIVDHLNIDTNGIYEVVA